jgi:hypothetical protein
MGSNAVKIKDVGRREIWMKESFVGVPTLKYYLVWILIIGGGSGLFTCGIAYSNLVKESDIAVTSLLIISGILLVMVGGMMNTVLSYGMKMEPAYTIYISGESNTKTIRKIDTETDATNVCHAARELEEKALVLSKTEHEMEQIALKCK